MHVKIIFKCDYGYERSLHKFGNGEKGDFIENKNSMIVSKWTHFY